MSICTSPVCARIAVIEGAQTHVTIREATPEERESIGPFWATGKNMRADHYLVVDADDPTRLLGAFGLASGGETREEAVFWAERWVSKNGGHLLRPSGWENVVGALVPDGMKEPQ